jgi:hypothetical protein
VCGLDSFYSVLQAPAPFLSVAVRGTSLSGNPEKGNQAYGGTRRSYSSWNACQIHGFSALPSNGKGKWKV